MRSGKRCSSRNCSLVAASSAPGVFKSTGLAPAATTTFVASNTSSPTSSDVGPTKRALAWKRRNAPLNETLFAIRRSALDKGTLELDQPRPINLSLFGANPVVAHAEVPIQEL